MYKISHILSLVVFSIFLICLSGNALWGMDFYTEEPDDHHPHHFRRLAVLAGKELANRLSKKALYTDPGDPKTYNIFILATQLDTYPTKTIVPSSKDKTIVYLTPRGLEACQIFLFNNTLYKYDLSPYSSPLLLNENSEEGDMMVMDELGNFFAHPKIQGKFHYLSFLGKTPLAFASLFHAENGRIKKHLTYVGAATFQKASLAMKIKKSAYKKLETDKQSFLLFHSKLTLFVPFKDLLYHAEQKAQGIYKLRRINLSNGSILRKSLIFGRITSLLKTGQHIIALSHNNSFNNSDSLPWKTAFHSFDLSTGEPRGDKEITHPCGTIEGLGVLKESNTAVYRGVFGPNNITLFFFNAETKEITQHRFAQKGSELRIIDGKLVEIHESNGNHTEGYIKIYRNVPDLKDPILLNTIKSPEVQIVGRNLFYKENEKLLVGFNLDTYTLSYKIPIANNSFSKFITFEVDGVVNFIGINKNGIECNIFKNNQFVSHWAFNKKDFWSFLTLERSRFSVDEVHKKLWGIHEDTEGKFSFYRWNIQNGILEYNEQINFYRTAKIINFMADGTPLVRSASF